jgi:hypothetical protein
MNLKDIMAISGHGGLFKFVAQGRNGIIVEGLEDKKRMNAYTSYKVSSLEDIAIFTESGEVPLKEVLKKIFEKENGAAALDGKADNAKLKTYMESILPDYDKEKVYVSDIKKLINWYNILQRNNMLDFTEEPAETSKPEGTDTPDSKDKA